MSQDKSKLHQRSYFILPNSVFWGWLSTESQPKNPEIRINPENFHPYPPRKLLALLALRALLALGCRLRRSSGYSPGYSPISTFSSSPFIPTPSSSSCCKKKNIMHKILKMTLLKPYPANSFCAENDLCSFGPLHISKCTLEYKLVPCYHLNSTAGILYSIIGCD